MVKVKTCKTCGDEKPLEAFDRYHNGKAEGWRGSCRECRAPAKLATWRNYYARHPERFKDRREAQKPYTARYYDEHRDEAIARAAKWRAENLERKREVEARYRRRNRARAAWHKAKRRADAGPDERDYIQILRGDPCAYCGAESDSVDHIEPVAGDGTGDWTNLTGSCRRCNSRKGAQPLLPFMLAAA